MPVVLQDVVLGRFQGVVHDVMNRGGSKARMTAEKDDCCSKKMTAEEKVATVQVRCTNNANSISNPAQHFKKFD